MTYEARTNGTHAIMCDQEGCDHELLAPTQEDVFGDANLAGWTEHGEGADAKHACTGCMRKASDPKAALRQMMQQAGPHVQAPTQVRKGDPVHDTDGNCIGTYAEDGDQGEAVPVDIDVDEMAKNLGIPDEPDKPGAGQHARFGAVMEGVDADDDARAYRSAVAPAGGSTGVVDQAAQPQGSPVAAAGYAAVAEDDSDPFADEPITFSEEAQTRARAAGIDLDNDDPFEGISWDPDDE